MEKNNDLLTKSAWRKCQFVLRMVYGWLSWLISKNSLVFISSVRVEELFPPLCQQTLKKSKWLQPDPFAAWQTPGSAYSKRVKCLSATCGYLANGLPANLTGTPLYWHRNILKASTVRYVQITSFSFSQMKKQSEKEKK